MQMISFVFWGLMAAVFFLLYLIGRIGRDEEWEVRAANGLLLIASYLFAAYGDLRFALILGALTVSTWLLAKKKKIKLGIFLSLAGLFFFKYVNFFAGSFSTLFGRDEIGLHLILPIGISFYTFSAISYLADVKQEKLEARGLLDVALYLSFFPKLTSGPIQRAGEFFCQIDRKRRIGWHTFSPGIQIFVFGLFKKIVLADRLSVFVNQVYKTPNVFGSITVLGAAIAYSLQIYFDFSGYSDMAVGVARILGIELPRNFNLPYLSHNVTEFWKRWHITLSSWLQDYLYISWGGVERGGSECM